METFKKLSDRRIRIDAAFSVRGYRPSDGKLQHQSLFKADADGEDVRVDYILDFAEIPTFQMFPELRTGALQPRVDDLASEWTRQLRLTADGQALTLRLEDSTVKVEPGAGGLSTVRVMLRLRSRWSSRGGTLHFTDPNFPDRIGWKEIVVQATPPLGFPEGNPFSADRSAALTQYPADLIGRRAQRHRGIDSHCPRIKPINPGVRRSVEDCPGTAAAPDRLSQILGEEVLPSADDLDGSACGVRSRCAARPFSRSRQDCRRFLSGWSTRNGAARCVSRRSRDVHAHDWRLPSWDSSFCFSRTRSCRSASTPGLDSFRD